MPSHTSSQPFSKEINQEKQNKIKTKENNAYREVSGLLPALGLSQGQQQQETLVFFFILRYTAAYTLPTNTGTTPLLLPHARRI
jgi:hypothetical protein